jgi:hypothetical protein
MEQSNILAWTLVSECAIPPEIDQILTTGEVAIAAYKTFRDSAIFTNKRLIVRDAQGLSGKKVEIYSLPYSSVLMWSSENGVGILNFNSELELWTKAGHIKVNLNKGLDIRRLDRLLSEAILGSSEVAGTITMPSARRAPATASSAPSRPAPPTAADSPREPGWLPDPNGAHEHRYWDGAAWTSHVSDGGVQSTD